MAQPLKACELIEMTDLAIEIGLGADENAIKDLLDRLAEPKLVANIPSARHPHDRLHNIALELNACEARDPSAERPICKWLLGLVRRARGKRADLLQRLAALYVAAGGSDPGIAELAVEVDRIHEGRRREGLQRIRQQYEARSPRTGARPFDEILTMSALEIIDWLETLSRSQSALACELCELLLPLATDWERLRRSHFAQLDRGDTRLQAPEANERLRDSYLAGLDGRPAQLQRRSQAWLGTAQGADDGQAEIKRPSIMDAPVFESVLADEVPLTIARAITADVDLGPADDAAIFAAALGVLRRRRVPGRRRTHNPYVVIDHAALPRLAAAIRARFPNLWLVCAVNMGRPDGLEWTDRGEILEVLKNFYRRGE